MRDEFDQSLEGARSKQRAKRRKTNLILNSLIVIVVVLIIFVAITIFSGGDKEKADQTNKEPNNEQVSGTENKSSSDQNNNESENNGDENKATDTNDQDEQTTNEDEEVIVEEGTNPNVSKTIINPSWKPVGTEQTGVHETVFEIGSLDWKEMEKALAYGAGLDHANMTTWFIANGGPNQAIGTVSAKDDQQAYRVYIQWVDDQGWKPTKVEELIENDKGQGSRNRE